MNRSLKANPVRVGRSRYWIVGLSTLALLELGNGAISLAQQAATASKNTPATTPTKSLVERPLLKLGSQGDEVKELQATLKLMGYYGGPVNGVYGQDTTAAVSKFQKAAGLSADGITGSATWNRLFPPAPISAEELPSTSSSSVPAASAAGFPSPTASRPTTQPLATQPTATPAQASAQKTAAAKAEPPAAAQPTSVDLPVLKLGMKGSAVMGLQERLRAIGVFSGSVDGVFGPETHAAVKLAQRNFSLAPDGVVGPATWVALLRHRR